MKYYYQNKIQRVYSWLGFIVFWASIGFIIWSMFEQDKAIEFLIKVVS